MPALTPRLSAFEQCLEDKVFLGICTDDVRYTLVFGVKNWISRSNLVIQGPELISIDFGFLFSRLERISIAEVASTEGGCKMKDESKTSGYP